MSEFTSMGQQRRFERLKNELQTDEDFRLTPPEGEDQDEPDSLGDQDTNEYIDDSRDMFEDDVYDGQPTEYEEWQDVYGGDDWDHGQYD